MPYEVGELKSGGDRDAFMGLTVSTGCAMAHKTELENVFYILKQVAIFRITMRKGQGKGF